MKVTDLYLGHQVIVSPTVFRKL